MPGANTNGSLWGSSRRRVAGSVQREAGTVKAGGRSGVSARDLVRMVELAELRAGALRFLRLARPLSFGSANNRRGCCRVGAIEIVHVCHERASCVPEGP